ncbi:RNA polymerase sigma factor [candidate division KSB1 bacterium]
MTETEEKILIEKILSGEREAFREIMEQYSSSVISVAYRMAGSLINAREIAQDVFVQVYRSLHKYDPALSFSSWLYRITVNKAIDHIRSMKRHIFESLDYSSNSSFKELEHKKGSLTDDRIVQQEFRSILNSILVKLTVNQRAVYVLRDLQECSTGEIARIMQCSRATVRVHLSNARRTIKEILIKDYPEYNAKERV